MLPCYRCTIIFENLFCSQAQKIIPCIIFCAKLIYSHESQCHKYQFNNFSPITVFSCHIMFMVNYGILRMKDFSDVNFFGCGMLGLWDVGDMGCWGCGIFGMWNARVVGCLGCTMWDVCWNVGCWFTKYPCFGVRGPIHLFHSQEKDLPHPKSMTHVKCFLDVRNWNVMVLFFVYSLVVLKELPSFC